METMGQIFGLVAMALNFLLLASPTGANCLPYTVTVKKHPNN